jgi:uncharacterized protein
MVRFDWDPEKDQANQGKHGLGFEQAAELFRSGTDYLEIFDETHSGDEDRFIAIGPIEKGLVLGRLDGACRGYHPDHQCPLGYRP